MLATLPASGVRKQSTNSRHSEGPLRNAGQADEEDGHEVVLREAEAEANQGDVYYELSSSNNDATESEEEEREDPDGLGMDEGGGQPLERDEYQDLRDRLAEDKNFLHATPPASSDHFEAAK